MSGASIYRCAECGHGRALIGYQQVWFQGPVGPDGHLTEHDEELPVNLPAEWDSIRCSLHEFAVIHKNIDGTWVRRIWCPNPLCVDGQVQENPTSSFFWNPCPVCRGRKLILVPEDATRSTTSPTRAEVRK